ncbi:hypothetical protein [Micromonospora sp. NPDC023956]|uniref:hypothetical protein n=1 Tax=Micromonospora sp. NPDC023956 TaxID=3155722 RepID=UPI0033F67E77
MKTQRIALPLLVACLALGACAGQDGSGNQDGGTAANPSQTGAPVTTPSEGTDSPGTPPAVPPTEGKPGGPSASAAPGGATITGTVTSGVEPGCLLLGEYLLVGGPRDMIKSGAKITVTGRVQADLMTTCQQGTPFLVDRVNPA